MIIWGITVVVVGEVVVDASVVETTVEPASFKMTWTNKIYFFNFLNLTWNGKYEFTSSGGGSESPKRDFVTQHFMAVLQSPSTLRTASQ